MNPRPFGTHPQPIEHLPALGPAYPPVLRETQDTVLELSRRDDPQVDLELPVHLLCVNFRTMRNSTYAYAGGRAVRGTRHLGSAHLVPADHRIEAHTPDATDHVVFRVKPARLRQLAEGAYGTDHVELRTDGLPFFDAAIFRIARAARDELRAGNPGGDLALGSVAVALGDHLLARHSNLAGRGRPRRLAISPAKLARLRDHVEANLASSLSLDDLAAVAGLSVGHFLKAFKATTGVSPHQHVLDRRVAYVRERLFEPGADLSALAARAGFASHSHMTSAFRARVGLTPSAFRAAAR
jgi:AraC family transcriptional regulator